MEFRFGQSNEVSKSFVSENKTFDPDKRIDVNQKHDIKNKQEYDVDNRVECAENVKNGGSYKEVKKHSDSETHEVHHMPADVISPIKTDDGPAIKMEKEDHRKTANWGSSSEAREYRAMQKELIDSGKFREAIQLDIDDIRGKFGNKYDGAISEMMKYVDKLESEGNL
ncbi:MAG: hypothetical protein J6A58_12805 [Oscillospiraceae bacterium]|nr:hypothetical protein [Oscillospiraceae bacterium]